MEHLLNASTGQVSTEASQTKHSKLATIIYWTLTVAFTGTMFYFGVLYFLETPAIVQNNRHLGYPLYLYKILGVGKMTGSVVILTGFSRLLKEWAYIGYALNLILAAVSHVLSGDSLGIVLIPTTILIVVLISYWLWKTGRVKRSTVFPTGH